MENAATVGVLDGLGQREHELRRKARFDRAGLFLEPVFQGRAVAIGEHKKAQALDLVGFIDGQDVRVLKAGESLGFAKKAGSQFGVAKDAGSRDLDGHLTPEPGVLGQIDDAERTRAKRAKDFVGTELSGPRRLCRLLRDGRFTPSRSIAGRRAGLCIHAVEVVVWGRRGGRSRRSAESMAKVKSPRACKRRRRSSISGSAATKGAASRLAAASAAGFAVVGQFGGEPLAAGAVVEVPRDRIFAFGRQLAGEKCLHFLGGYARQAHSAALSRGPRSIQRWTGLLDGFATPVCEILRRRWRGIPARLRKRSITL